jgi:hypothetical protein
MSEAQNIHTSWEVKRLSPALGAEVRGLRIADCGADDINRIWDLLHEHQVIF